MGLTTGHKVNNNEASIQVVSTLEDYKLGHSPGKMSHLKAR